MGNVLAVITPDASDATQPAIESLTDYYPFGMEEPGRSYNSNASRFGYTGHEKENDLAEGVYTTQYRLLDTRLGRWMSVDPLAEISPSKNTYNYCSGNPIILKDPDGRIDCTNGNVNIDFNDTKTINDLINQRITQNPDLSTYFNNLINNPSYRIGVATTTDKDGKHNPFLVAQYIPQNGQSPYDQLTEATNCFGISFAGGQVFFPTGFDAMQVINDECELATEGLATKGVPEYHTSDAREYPAGDLAHAMAGDIIVFFDNNNVPFHAAEIISVGEEYADFIHKDGNLPASINRGTSYSAEGMPPNVRAGAALIEAYSWEMPPSFNGSYRVYRYREEILKPNDVQSKQDLIKDRRIYINGDDTDMNTKDPKWSR